MYGENLESLRTHRQILNRESLEYVKNPENTRFLSSQFNSIRRHVDINFIFINYKRLTYAFEYLHRKIRWDFLVRDLREHSPGQDLRGFIRTFRNFRMIFEARWKLYTIELFENFEKKCSNDPSLPGGGRSRCS